MTRPYKKERPRFRQLYDLTKRLKRNVSHEDIYGNLLGHVFFASQLKDIPKSNDPVEKLESIRAFYDGLVIARRSVERRNPGIYLSQIQSPVEDYLSSKETTRFRGNWLERFVKLLYNNEGSNPEKLREFGLLLDENVSGRGKLRLSALQIHLADYSLVDQTLRDYESSIKYRRQNCESKNEVK